VGGLELHTAWVRAAVSTSANCLDSSKTTDRFSRGKLVNFQRIGEVDFFIGNFLSVCFFKTQEERHVIHDARATNPRNTFLKTRENARQQFPLQRRGLDELPERRTFCCLNPKDLKHCSNGLAKRT
jgi:hypothetical protein